VTCDRFVVSSTNKTDCPDITKILLKVALNTIILTPQPMPLYYTWQIGQEGRGIPIK
jgi:hypothetical protein